MKKIYSKPVCKAIVIEETELIAESLGTGLTTGCSLGNEYNGSDVSYVKGLSDSDLWDSEW